MAHPSNGPTVTWAGGELGTGEEVQGRNTLCSHKTQQAESQEETLHPLP